MRTGQRCALSVAAGAAVVLTSPALAWACSLQSAPDEPTPLKTDTAFASPASVGAASVSATRAAEAVCGAGSYPEQGLQGEQPDSDLAARLEHGYRCNLELVGQYTGDGGNIQIAWSGECAYMGTLYSPADPEFQSKKGTVVIDASDPTRPKEVRRLQTTAMVSPSESLRVHDERGLLAAVQGPNTGDLAEFDGGPRFAFYDVSDDCQNPRLLSELTVDGFVGHEGAFSADGMTYYGIDISGGFPKSNDRLDPSVAVVDIGDPTHPRPILEWKTAKRPASLAAGFHGASFAGDNNDIGYFPLMSGGLAVLDLASLHNRQAGAEPRLLSELKWPDAGQVSAVAVPAIVAGRRYVFVADELGARWPVARSCAEGRPPYGGVHAVDATDPAKPREVALIHLEVNDPASCRTIERSKVHRQGHFFYGAHYCDVDDPTNATALACSWQGAGLRIFDIRDPARPREIAYYNPRPRPEVVRGNQFKPNLAFPDQSYTGTRIRWHRADDGSMHLWFMSMENGFQIVRFTNGAYPLEPSPSSSRLPAPELRDTLPASGAADGPFVMTGVVSVAAWFLCRRILRLARTRR